MEVRNKMEKTTLMLTQTFEDGNSIVANYAMDWDVQWYEIADNFLFALQGLGFQVTKEELADYYKES
jgi:hypothetical protein